MRRASLVVALVLPLFGAAGTASAAEVSQDAIDACIDGLRAQGAQGGTVVSTEFSEANSLVMLESGGVTWRCLVDNAGRSPFLERADAPPAGGDAATAAPAGPAFWEVSVDTVLNVHSSPSTSSPVIARLPRGRVVENRGCLDAEGRTWCEVADGDASGWAASEYLVPSSGSARGEDTATADDGGGAMAGAPAEPTTTTEVVRFAPGRTGTDVSGSLTPGSSARYELGAADGQFLTVEFYDTDPAIEYQIFNPDGSFLLDMMNNAQRYRGQLWQTGDHVVEVINRSDGVAPYTMAVTIE